MKPHPSLPTSLGGPSGGSRIRPTRMADQLQKKEGGIEMGYSDRTMLATRHLGRLSHRHIGIDTYIQPSVAVSGTCVAAVLESEVVTGGETIILTLTDGKWVPAGTLFNAQRQNIIDGLDSAQAEAAGWDAEVKGKEVVTAVVRTSDTVVTITLTASASYSITAGETITVTVPASAIEFGEKAVVGSPTFTVTEGS